MALEIYKKPRIVPLEKMDHIKKKTVILAVRFFRRAVKTLDG